MEFPMEEIRDELISGNFNEAEKKSRHWLESFSISQRDTAEYKRASEAYMYAQYLLNRQDSIQRLQSDDQRARYFQDVLRDINQLREKNKFEKSDNPVWRGMDNFLHARIAENYARAFAGQKSYNLDQNEIIQLSLSLIYLEKWNSAIESLDFLLRLNRHNPEVNYLMAYVYGKMQQREKFQSHLRDALFYKPDVISLYPDYLPGEIFEKYWITFNSQSDSGKYRYREFALLLELNNVYATELEMSERELHDLERILADKIKIYQSKADKHEMEISELLHYLCWIILRYQKMSVFDKIEYYRKKMIELSPDAWESFNSKRR